MSDSNLGLDKQAFQKGIYLKIKSNNKILTALSRPKTSTQNLSGLCIPKHATQVLACIYYYTCHCNKKSKLHPFEALSLLVGPKWHSSSNQEHHKIEEAHDRHYTKSFRQGQILQFGRMANTHFRQKHPKFETNLVTGGNPVHVEACKNLGRVRHCTEFKARLNLQKIVLLLQGLQH